MVKQFLFIFSLICAKVKNKKHDISRIYYIVNFVSSMKVLISSLTMRCALTVGCIKKFTFNRWDMTAR